MILLTAAIVVLLYVAPIVEGETGGTVTGKPTINGKAKLNMEINQKSTASKQTKEMQILRKATDRKSAMSEPVVGGETNRKSTVHDESPEMNGGTNRKSTMPGPVMSGGTNQKSTMHDGSISERTTSHVETNRSIVYEIENRKPIVFLNEGRKPAIHWEESGKPIAHFEEPGEPIMHSDKSEESTEGEGTNEIVGEQRKKMEGKDIEGEEREQDKNMVNTAKNFKQLLCYSGITTLNVQKCSGSSVCYKQITLSGEVLRGCDKTDMEYSLCKGFKMDKCGTDEHLGLVCCCSTNKCNGANNVNYDLRKVTVLMILSIFLIKATV
uniref:Uncharacterized protein n=1 Tax=Onchocerca volvulus TaxID=6282 RepID=A0A8R1Y214_ONCVO